VTDEEFTNLLRGSTRAIAYANPKTVAIVEEAIKRRLPDVCDLRAGRMAYEPPTGDENDSVVADPNKLGRRVAARKGAKKAAAPRASRGE
jgi:hypothetical protein